MQNLKQKTINGLFWSGADSFGVYFLKFGFSIAIARILSPEDYGLVGMMAIFIGIATWMSEGGFMAALIQKKDVDQTDFSTAFFFNISISLIFYILFYFSAGMISRFFNEPRLIIITRVISLNFVIGAAGLVQLTIFIKKLDFKIQAKINAFAAVLSGIFGLFLAYKGFGVWALIFQTLVGNLFRISLLWIVSSWRPIFIFSFKSFINLFSYGYKIFLQGLLDSIFLNIYSPIIGKKFSAFDLGFYTRANRFYVLFVRRLTMVFSKVTFPAFCTIQNDKDKLVYGYKSTLGLMSFIIFPIITILIVTAKPFVLFFLTEKWMPVVPYMKLLYIEGFFFPIYILNTNIFNSLGRSDIFLKIDLLKKALILISILITIRFGISGLIIGQLISSFIVFIISCFIVSKKINFSIFNQFIEIIPILSISLIVYLLCIFISSLVFNTIILLIIQSGIGLAAYFIIFRTFKIKVYNDFRSLVICYLPEKLKWIL